MSDIDNIVSRIHKQCITDHANYINGFINDTKQSFKQKCQIYDEYKKVLRDMTVTHPRLMAYIINQKGSGLTYDDIKQDINKVFQYQNGQIGGQGESKQEQESKAKNLIEHVKSIMEKVNKVDPKQLTELKTNIDTKLNQLKSRVENIDNKININHENVINNLDTVLTSVETITNAKNILDVKTQGMTMYNPKIILDEKSMDMKIIIKDLVNEYSKLFPESLNLSPKIIEYLNGTSKSLVIDQQSSELKLTDKHKELYSTLEKSYNELIKKIAKLKASITQLENIYIIDETDNYDNIKFLPKLSELKTKLNNEMSDNEFVKYYNNLPDQRKQFPKKYFDKDYTERINNSIFKKIEKSALSKTDLLNANLEQMRSIYNPDFSTFIKIRQKGGNNFTSLNDNLIKYAGLLKKYGLQIVTYNNLVAKLNNMYNDVYAYMRYLILISTNQLFSENYVIYKYINKGLLLFYLRILTRMNNDLDGKSDKPHILFIRKYYKIIIKRLYNFIGKIVYHMLSTDIININEITDQKIKNNMTLFNYFKPIMESYNEMFQSQITIYARLNDISSNLIDYSKKVFISDQERIDNDSKNSNVGKGGDSKVMIVNKNVCLSNNEKPDTYNFTEVFDSKYYTTNEDISKYMTLETQLGKKKGVCLMTYGYSGTGKTYTLFGNESKQGLLQSTLNNVTGLYTVRFRLFEIYGIGLPYTFYWTENNAPRMNKINHNIFHYDIELNNDMISVRTMEKYTAPNFSTYMNNTETYITIKGDSIKKIFDNFKKFTDTIDKYRKLELKSENPEIDKIKRIRPTPNNPESSRSVLIYDFELYVGSTKDTPDPNDKVRFLIIDLPGREELNETYIKPYFDHDVIKKYVFNNDKALERIKLIITCMALNPIGLSAFHPEIIINTVNESTEKSNVYREILSQTININNDPLSNWVELQDGKLQYNSGKNRVTGVGYETKTQEYAVGAVFVMYQLLMDNKFELIQQIYEKILNVEINNKIDSLTVTDEIKNKLKTDGFKGKIGNEISGDIGEIKELLKYDYTMTPFEGIYINENIAGLTNFLGKKLIKDSGKTDSSKNHVDPQKEINLDTLRNITRVWLMSTTEIYNNKTIQQQLDSVFGQNTVSINNTPYIPLYIGKKNDIKDYKLPTDTSVTQDELKELNNYILSGYSSNKIYSEKKELITDILSPFIENENKDNTNVIKDYKIFYLFANYDNDEKTKFKCSHQIKLLENTKDFINSVIK